MEYSRFIVSALISLIINLLAKIKKGSLNNILIIRLDHLGDMACTLEAIKNVRIKFNSSKITLMTGGWNSELFLNKYLVDDIITYNSPVYSRNKNIITPIRERINIYRNLRKLKFSLIISFRDDFFTLWLSLLLFPGRRLDRGTVRIKMKLSKFYFALVKKVRLKFPHEIDTNKTIISPLIKDYVESRELFKFNENEKIWAKLFFEKNRIKNGEFAVFHPGAAWNYRRWSVDNFIKIGEYLNNNYNIKILVIGTPEEIEIAQKLSNFNSNIFLNIVGKTNLRELLLLIDACKLVICNDSGPMHLASVMGKPTFALLGPQRVERFGPRGKNVIYFHKEVECYPCEQILCKHSELPCVNLNTVEEVEKAITMSFKK